MSEEPTISSVDGEPELRRETRFPFASEKWVKPKPWEIAQVMRAANLSSGALARLVGVATQRVRSDWLRGRIEMPYAPWRLLLIYARLALDSELDEPSADSIDAERYRWLKTHHLQLGPECWIRTGDDLDESIDSEIARKS